MQSTLSRVLVVLALFGALAGAGSARAQTVCQSDMTTACQSFSGRNICPLQQQACTQQLVSLIPLRLEYRCPAGAQHPCIATGAGAPRCSPIACVAPAPRAQCEDGLDNDGDGRTDFPFDPGCTAASDNDESNPPPAACEDTLDNDGDGRADFPNDPGCSAATDTDEADPPPAAVCADGLDNDGDGRVDLADPGCSASSDMDESNPPAAACSDALDNDGDGRTDFPNDPGCTSASDADEAEAPTPVCSDGVDNDGDGLTDHPSDPGCASATDPDEFNAPPAFQCSDGLDNDSDGRTDFPADSGCTSATDDVEYVAPVVNACGDALDNDGDGLTDFPNDPGCVSAADSDETDPTAPAACSDGLDNDGDGVFDMADPGCSAPTDTSEVDPSPVYLCSDAIDNDGDGLVDHPNDPGCTSATDNDEFDGPLPACRDGADNDGDGRRDYPADDGCASFDDNSEDTLVCRTNCFCSANPDVGSGDTGGTDPDPDDPSFTDCPASSTGAVCPLNRQECTQRTYSIVDPNTGAATSGSGYECPSSPNSTCSVDPADGRRYCSPHVCVSRTTTPDDTVDTGGDFPAGDGPRDAQGNCLGQINLFSGAAKRCRRSGTQTAYQNCCNNRNPPLDDTVGAEGEPNQIDYREENSSFEFYDNQCDIQDQETSLLADSDYCVYLGTYCAERWPLVGCVQRNRSYCCFNSKLARMIQEQGRAQIPSMGGFGSARSPNCRGFTMEEFQSLDFTKMDLSGYYADIRTKGQATIQGEAQDAARRRFNP